ncbi:MAG: CDP-diacylglycerol--glycerol-3-phosphate 3-phosphatidyltransferase [Rickettsiales bacterium]|nr:CDP-diacylglycerol--glycerol-3-phosphate 3-phosphatidyltransferase [Rickettsiales bacterium]
MKNLPNCLTFLRILIVPILISSFFLEGVLSNWIAASLFVIASATDFFDGYLARTLGLESNLGKVLDPIADKLLVATAIVMLAHSRADIIITISGIVILFREIFVSGWREYLAGINVSLPVSNLAKWKTAIQMTALTVLILGNKGAGFEYTDSIGKILLVLAAILTIITGYSYLKSTAKHLGDSSK